MIEVKKLVMSIDSYLQGRISGDELEQITLGIIADDEFDHLRSEIQDAIYTLDSKELNELTRSEIQEIRNILARAE
jgi:hypothetical protein